MFLFANFVNVEMGVYVDRARWGVVSWRGVAHNNWRCNHPLPRMANSTREVGRRAVSQPEEEGDGMREMRLCFAGIG
jgi:hypothetical protein